MLTIRGERVWTLTGNPRQDPPPRQFSNAEFEAQLDCVIPRAPGKHPDYGGGTRKREECELNWSKRSIFFELPYWSSLQLKHNETYFSNYHIGNSSNEQ